MMGYKKFLLIPALFVIYVFVVVDILVSFNPMPTNLGTTTPSGGGQPIGVVEMVTVKVTRPYFFGMFRLPVYTNYIGYIGGYHQIFFYFLIGLTVFFIVTEMFIEISWGQPSAMSKVKAVGEPRRKSKMAKKGWNMKDIAKAVGIGAGMGFLIYILSNDGGAATGIGLLVMYLEHRMK